MRDADPLAFFEAVLRDLESWLVAAQVPYAVVGGVAAGTLGEPRATQDLDAVILPGDQSEESLILSAKEHGFEPRIEEAAEFARSNLVLLLRHSATKVPVDAIFGLTPFEQEMVDQAVRVSVRHLEIPMPTRENLIVMKLVAGRDRDLRDVESLLMMQPDLNRGHVLRWLREFAQALDAPEMLTTAERILGPTHRR